MLTTCSPRGTSRDDARVPAPPRAPRGRAAPPCAGTRKLPVRSASPLVRFGAVTKATMTMGTHRVSAAAVQPHKQEKPSVGPLHRTPPLVAQALPTRRLLGATQQRAWLQGVLAQLREVWRAETGRWIPAAAEGTFDHVRPRTLTAHDTRAARQSWGGTASGRPSRSARGQGARGREAP